MNTVEFCKFHGFGNDYIVIDKENLGEIPDIGEFARKICHRNFGVGSDGIALLERLDGESAHFSCRIINPDGSEADFSGNGTRCAVAYLYFKGLWSGRRLKLQTKSGIKNYDFLERDGNTFWFLAEVGKPRFSSNEIPFVSDEELEEVVYHKLKLSDRTLPVTALNVGNPACVLFVEDFEFNWRKVGAEIEQNPQFPEKTNVVFVKIIDTQNVEIRIWERGAGETSSSGTCSIAAAVASIYTDQTERAVSVRAPGGITNTVWREDNEMMISGRADLVFCGEWFEDV